MFYKLPAAGLEKFAKPQSVIQWQTFEIIKLVLNGLECFFGIGFETGFETGFKTGLD